MLYIKNVHIKSMVEKDIENGEILIENGKIKAVGKKIDDAEFLDENGNKKNFEILELDNYIATPGLIDGHCHIGLWEEGIGFEGEDGNEDVEPITPQLRAIDGINPFDDAFFDALTGGVTTVVTGPGSANIVGGQFVAIKTAGKIVDKMILKDPVAMKIAFGENPKRVYSDQHKSPVTRMAIAAMLRELLYEAKSYKEEIDESVSDPDRKPDFDLKLHSMLPVMNREMPLKAHAHRADDIFTAIRIAKEFNLKITLDHCTEGHLVADELKELDIPVFVGPTFGSKSKVELRNKSFDTARILSSKGIKIGIITDACEIPIQFLSTCAGWAVQAGMNETEAWKAITINPAQIIGIDDRVGSIEVGKDADIAIFKSDPIKSMDFRAYITIVNGKIVHQL